MARPTLVVEGLRELRRDMRHIADAGLNQELREANKEIAQRIVDKAIPNVPVRTGALRSSVRALGNLGGAVGKAGSALVPYAGVIHWGWPRRGIPARPFLKNAADSIESDVVVNYERRILRLLDKVNARSL